jgi:hypothetical protein
VWKGSKRLLRQRCDRHHRTHLMRDRPSVEKPWKLAGC